MCEGPLIHCFCFAIHKVWLFAKKVSWSYGGPLLCGWRVVFAGMGYILSLVALLTFVIGCMTMTAALVLYSNCSSRPEWIPDSKPLCHDLYQWTTTGAPPDAKNLKLAAVGLGGAVKSVSKVLTDRIIAVDYGVWGTQVSHGFSRAAEVLRTTDYGKLAEDSWTWTKNRTMTATEWTRKELGPLMKRTVEKTVWLWDEGKVVLRWTLDATFRGVQWASDGVQRTIADMPTYWEKVKYYWNNMK